MVSMAGLSNVSTTNKKNTYYPSRVNIAIFEVSKEEGSSNDSQMAAILDFERNLERG